MKALEPLFDAAVQTQGTPFFFRSDIAEDSRVIAIGGSRTLIESGDPQGAVFWLGATFARCMKILDADAPHRLEEFAPAFAAFQEDLGLVRRADYFARAQRTLASLPVYYDAAMEIARRNPEVRHSAELAR